MDLAELVGRIDQIPAASWKGSGWRHVASGRQPLSGEGARITGGRWNPPRSFSVLYLGSTRETVIAEFHRLAARQRLDPAEFLPRILYRYDVNLTNMLDLTEEASLAMLDTTGIGISGNDLTVPRGIGEAVFASGREGVVAPSAAGHGVVLAVYPERLGAGSYVKDEESEMWEQVPGL